ncbi:ROK family protein [Actinosynnema pretiosum subsp. pretiosum]|uniref:ROK family protein n=2 Tax=Actinosynnema TaxID=40566 RepID=C6WLD3_ACTMD|nr:ROK family transcriptional regulator [Actinosynnema mirum]ACU38326.1 ROK family protein [Actinosynnema mirum DSM 43827]AXX31850.1 Xylose-responsive transcription regulator, ROK family [Actinosynnema pretiosum subsp. pretiosum]QUF04163.1 ROK family protein [Actinosynnema pretiosum subsp. pretiosum]
MRNFSSDVRKRNRTSLLRHLHLQGPTTRTALSEALDLNRSTIKSLVDELTEEGLVDESATSGSRGAGRPSLLVVPGTRSTTVLAIDIRINSVSTAVVGLGGEVLVEQRWALPPHERSPAEVCARIARRAAQALSEADHRVRAVGISVPGVVRRTDSVVRDAPNLGWNDVPLREHVSEALGLPVEIGNDAELGALAEGARGVGRTDSDVAYVYADVGVGGGVVSRGTSVFGPRNHVGEFGHMVVRHDGRACYCGCEGCWETEIGRAALTRALGVPEDLDDGVLVRRLRALAADPVSGRAALREPARWLALGLCNLVNVLGAELLVLGGLLAELPPSVVAGVEEAVRTRSIVSKATAGARVVRSPLGTRATLIGAAELAFERTLSSR